MDLFFELLQVSLGTRDLLSCVPTDDEWVSLMEEAKRQAVLGVMMSGLERLSGQVIVPEEVMVKWFSRAQKAEKQYDLHRARVHELSSLFRNAGFANCVLKGISISRYYPLPQRRQSGDIDLWVAGPRKDVMAWLRSRYKIGHNVWHNVGVEVFMDVPVEIHFHPAWVYNPIDNHHLQLYFESKKQAIMASDSQGCGYACPPVEFDAVFSLVHTFRHLIAEGVGFRHIVDYYYVLCQLNREGEESISYVLGIIRKAGLSKFASAMMWVLQEVCGMPSSELLCAPNEREGRFLLDEVLRGGNFGHHRHDNRRRNSFARTFALLPHYPSEVLWMFPWKVWHWFWRKRHGSVA